MDKKYKYDAFISYRHFEFDKMVASKLQLLLESYKPPGGTPKNAKNKKKIQRVFRDETELPSSGDLAEDIKLALEDSEYLIVICSKETKNSPWCMQEIQYFKELHGGSTEQILTLLIEGDHREVFPLDLQYEIDAKTGEKKAIEPLAANITASSRKESMAKLKSEFLRIVAPILGRNYDDLYRRNRRRRNRRIIGFGIAILTIVVSFSAYALINASIIASQNRQLLDSILEIREQQLFRTLSYAEGLIEDGDRVEATSVLMEAYNNFDTESEEYLKFQKELEVLLAKSIYYPSYEPYALLEHKSHVVDAAFSLDNSMLFTLSADGVGSFWNADTGAKLLQVEEESMGGICEFFGEYVVTSDQVSYIMMWDIEAKHMSQKIEISLEEEEMVLDLRYHEGMDAVVCLTTKGFYFLSKEGLGEKQTFMIEVNDLFHQEYRIKISDNAQFIAIYGETEVEVIQLFEEGRIEHDVISHGSTTLFPIYEISNDGILYLVDWQYGEQINSYQTKIAMYNVNTETLILEQVIEGKRYGRLEVPNRYDGSFVGLDVTGLHPLLEYVECKEDGSVKAVEIEVPMAQELVDDVEVIFESKGQFTIFYNDFGAHGYLCEVDRWESYDGDQLYVAGLEELPTTDSLFSYLCRSSDGERILTSYLSGESSLYSTEGNFVSLSFYEEENSFYNAELSSISDNFRGVSFRGEVKSLVDGTMIQSITPSEGYVIKYGQTIISIDGDFVIANEIHEENGVERWCIWEVETGRIHNHLEQFNELFAEQIKEQNGWAFSISDNFRYIAMYLEGNLYVYDIEQEVVIYENPEPFMASKLFMQNDGKSIVLVDEYSSTVYYLDLESNTLEYINNFHVHGIYKETRAVNLEEDRIIIGASLTLNSSYRLYVYTISTGELLYELTQFEPDAEVFNLSPSGYTMLAKTLDYYEDSIYEKNALWQIPSRIELEIQGTKMAEERPLNEEERTAAGLELFDYE